jgi:DNA-directed RNA polymerase subunit M/transcription elongation factor TFIIS
MKTCTKCNVVLNVGVNIAPSLWNNSTYVCKTCYYNKNKIYNKHYIVSNKDKKAKAQEKYLDKIPAGVYCVRELGNIIYIGESSKPLRRYYGHFTKQGGQENNISAINNYIHFKGKDKFTFEMMCFENKKTQRLQYEKQLQQLYKPIFN